MPLRLRGAIIALLLPTLACAQPAPPADIQIQGAVAAPGRHSGGSQGRLADAIVQAKPRADAYLLGSSFMRVQERNQQLRLRAGLAYDLQQLTLADDAAIRSTAGQLLHWLQQHPATGRVVLPITPRLMQVLPQQNPPLAAGDALLVPTRPTSIRIIGAVEAECVLPHEPQRDALDYLRDCPASKAADRSDIYVIQPDGQVQQLGIALWNRADPQSIAAGGTLYVPIRASALAALDSAFNREFATFIATQPVVP